MTGLGAVTPIGVDAPSTWRAAVAGESGIDFIRSFDASEFPVRIAAEVKDFDPAQVASPKDARRLDRNVLLSLGAAREAVADARLDGAYSPDRVGILFGTAIGGFLGIMEQAEVLRERGPDRVAPTFLPNVLVDTASGQLAISLGFRGVLENDGGELALWSRNGRPLLRYFPELRPLGDLLPPHSALDGVGDG